MDSKTNMGKVGAKAYNIIKSRNIAKIPNGFVLTFKTYTNFIEQNNINKEIDYHLCLLNKKKESMDKASKIIKSYILKGELSDEIKKEINQYIKKLKAPYAVRSSANIEDSKKLSFAGLYDTFLNVEKCDLEKNIKLVFASIFNKEALFYLIHNNQDIRKMKMAVIIQEMINGQKFGVAFSIKENGKNVKIVECGLKNPSIVTAGNLIPDLYIIKGKKIEYHTSVNEISNLFRFEIHKISELLDNLKKIVYPLDIEWAFDNDKLFLLQLRYLTRDVKIPFLDLDIKKFRGIPIYHGIVEGDAEVKKGICLNEKINQKEKNNKILVVDNVGLGQVSVINKYAGIIIEFSGITSHIAILAREYKIPCIVGVGNATDTITNGDKLRINGLTGQIKLLNKKGFTINFNKKYTPTNFDLNKIKLFRNNDDVLILYPLKDYFAVSYDYVGPKNLKRKFLNQRLSELIPKIFKKYNTILVDAGSRFGEDSGLVLDMKETDKDMNFVFHKGLKVLESGNIKKIKSELDKTNDRVYSFVNRSKRKYKNYIHNKDIPSIASALELCYKSFAYWRIFNVCMLGDQAEFIIGKLSDRDADKLKKFIKRMWTYEFESGNGNLINIIKLKKRIHKRIKKDFDIKIEPSTSFLTFVKKVKSLQ